MAKKGRPKNEMLAKRNQVNLKITDAELHILEEYAKNIFCSKTEILRIAMLEYFFNHK